MDSVKAAGRQISHHFHNHLFSQSNLTSTMQVSIYKHYFINNINNKYNISHMFILQLTTAKKSTTTIKRTKHVCQYKVIHIQFKFKKYKYSVLKKKKM